MKRLAESRCLGYENILNCGGVDGHAGDVLDAQAPRADARLADAASGERRPFERSDWRSRFRILSAVAALALAGCQTTKYLTTACVTQQQYDQLKAQEPSKIHDKLTGQADKDTRPLAGSILELRSYSETLLGVIQVCAQSNQPNK